MSMYEWIGVAIAAVFSFVMFYAPKSESWWALLDGGYKRLIILGGCFVIAVFAMGMACIGIDVGGNFVCPVGVDNQFWYNFVSLVVKQAFATQVAFGLAEAASK